MIRLRVRRDAPGGTPTARPAMPGAPHPRAPGMAGTLGEVVRLGDPPLLLIGTGPARKPGEEPDGTVDWEAVGGHAAAALGEAERAALDARGLPPAVAARLAAGAALRAWRFEATRSAPRPGLRRLDLLVDDPAATLRAWEPLEAGVRGALLARELVAEPANRLTPRRFARRLRGLAAHGLEVEVIKHRTLAAMGAGGLLAVGCGAAEPPRLVVIRWPGDPGRVGDAAPVVLVGKGICFDTGGISIKPAAGMEAMRGDMAGAAACAGAMLALALRRSPAPAAAVLAIAENSTDGDGYRPGDVLRMLSGRSVEVVDTDAEGRLVLADALTHAVRALSPALMVTVATLTGAVVSALGHERAGLFGGGGAPFAAAMAAGEAVGERLWPLPIGVRHRDDLGSAIADLRHCLPSGGGDGWGGRFMPDASHAAAFLREFTDGVPWLHLDIAGVAGRDADAPMGARGPTGFGARLLDRLVSDRFEERRRRG